LYTQVVKRLSPKVVEVRENPDQRIASGLVRDLLKLVTQEGQAPAAARRLEACGAQEQRVQTSDRLVASGAVGPKSEEPLVRSVVDRGAIAAGSPDMNF
jgi:hypothetical protein